MPWLFSYLALQACISFCSVSDKSGASLFLPCSHKMPLLMWTGVLCIPCACLMARVRQNSEILYDCPGASQRATIFGISGAFVEFSLRFRGVGIFVAPNHCAQSIFSVFSGLKTKLVAKSGVFVDIGAPPAF